MVTSLRAYNNSWYHPGACWAKRFAWYFCNALVFEGSLFPQSALKVRLLRLFGAKIGKRVTIKPNVNIKFPWKLVIGDDTWIGEKVWIDNLADVHIGSNVCISQGAMLLCGNHDYGKPTFDLIVKPITIEDGAWIAARAMVSQGVTIRSHAVLSIGSITSKDLDAYTIYRGNPAVEVGKREIEG